MTAAPIHFRNERLMLDPSGAAFWPARRVLIVADLHFEKSTAFAAQGALLPPYDTRAALERLTRLVRLYRPAKLVALGDSFHDCRGPARLAKDDRARIEAMARETQIIWVAGNHDAAPHDLPGQCVAEHREGPFVFRHEAAARLGMRDIEISGHFHPKASIDSRAKRISRPCFVTDPARLILPAFGSFTGGLDVRDPAIARLFPRGLRVFLLGQEQLYSFALEQLGRLAEVA
ncbi:MAG: ligase-associated DNA damage response endonuclease PdeM [Rhodospirillales bacterium]|nr:ligase-associated DNA damage response endonuclease PdeM [Rhodospirillales bacterium]